MGTLRTFAWTTIGSEPNEFGHRTATKGCVEIVVPLENVSHAIGHTDPSGGPTTLLSMRQINPTLGGETIHVDVPIDQMEKILHRHSVDPSRRFRTHKY